MIEGRSIELEKTVLVESLILTKMRKSQKNI